MSVVEGRPIPTRYQHLQQQRRQQLHSTREDRRAGPGEDPCQHLAQHLEQLSQPGIATQQAQEAAAQPEVVALNNHMELRRSEEQKKDP